MQSLFIITFQLNEKAQAWAETLLNNQSKLMASPGKRPYAENLFKISGGDSISNMDAIVGAMKAWASSDSWFNYTNPKPTGTRKNGENIIEMITGFLIISICILFMYRVQSNRLECDNTTRCWSGSRKWFINCCGHVLSKGKYCIVWTRWEAKYTSI